MTDDTQIALDPAGVAKYLPLTSPPEDLDSLRARIEDANLRPALIAELEAQQSQFLEDLLAADDVGWTSRAGASDAVLVEAESGISIAAFDGRPISCDQPVTYPKADLPWDKYLPLLTDFEGFYPYMYLDINNFVTVAIGQMMPDAEAAATLNQGQLPFFGKSDGGHASSAVVQAEYDRVAALTNLASRGAPAFASATTLVVREADATLLAESEAKSHLKEALQTRKYPDFETYPVGVQMAITDLAFNLGVPKFITQFVSFQAAVLDRDWRRAQTESHRRDLGRRNDIVASWFDDAITAERFFILLTPKGASSAPRKILTMDGSLRPL
jgi:GH24 family phage-related lysozyme (muramidase)